MRQAPLRLWVRSASWHETAHAFTLVASAPRYFRCCIHRRRAIRIFTRCVFADACGDGHCCSRFLRKRYYCVSRRTVSGCSASSQLQRQETWLDQQHRSRSAQPPACGLASTSFRMLLFWRNSWLPGHSCSRLDASGAKPISIFFQRWCRWLPQATTLGSQWAN
jgi:hypothetical protein